MTEAWLEELDKHYFEQDWEGFGNRFSKWYEQASKKTKLMLLRRLQVQWRHERTFEEVLNRTNLS